MGVLPVSNIEYLNSLSVIKFIFPCENPGFVGKLLMTPLANALIYSLIPAVLLPIFIV